MNELEWGPLVLAWTPHSILAAPYHRLSSSILTMHQVFAGSPDEARAILAGIRATYVVTCGSLATSDLASGQPAVSLGDRLQAGEVPDWLEPVPQTQGQTILAYRVKP